MREARVRYLTIKLWLDYLTIKKPFSSGKKTKQNIHIGNSSEGAFNFRVFPISVHGGRGTISLHSTLDWQEKRSYFKKQRSPESSPGQ